MQLECSHANECKFKGTLMCLVCAGKVKDNVQEMKKNQDGTQEISTEERLKEVKIQLRALQVEKLRLEKQLKKEKKQRRARMI